VRGRLDGRNVPVRRRLRGEPPLLVGQVLSRRGRKPVPIRRRLRRRKPLRERLLLRRVGRQSVPIRRRLFLRKLHRKQVPVAVRTLRARHGSCSHASRV
jgi:hypothetical protein